MSNLRTMRAPAKRAVRRVYHNRAEWFDALAPSLTAEAKRALSPERLAAWRVARQGIRAIKSHAAVDAARQPLRTPCLDRWRQDTPLRYSGPLYTAAVWEAAGHETQDAARRERCFAYARAIIAVARGELVPFHAVAAEWL